MGKMFTDEQVAKARNANLYAFLLKHHPDQFKQEGHSLRFLADDSITIQEDCNLFMDWTDMGVETAGKAKDKPNAISFLVNHLGYSFVSAVNSLLNDERCLILPPIPKKPNTGEIQRDFILPEKNENYRQTLAYLTKTRGLEAEILQRLIKHGLLYQEKGTNNAVFLSPDKTFYELEGTLSDKRFKRAIAGGKLHAWYLYPDYYHNPAWTPSKVYLTESAIDAISLYQLLSDSSCVYVSTAGVGNVPKIIEQMERWKDKLVIATDNDEAGNKPRNQFPDLPTIRPKTHDWNDDVKARMEKKAKGA